MDYQQFIKLTAEKLQERFTDKGTVNTQTVILKHTTKIRTVSLYQGNDAITPLIYMAPFYNMYRMGYDFKKIETEIGNIVLMLESAQDVPEDVFLDISKAADYLALRLIPYKGNEKILELVPHRRYLDMAVIYQMIFKCSEKSIGTALVYNDHCRIWNVSEDVLFQLAVKSMPSILPEHFFVLDEMFPFMVQRTEGDAVLYVLTNIYSFFGAAAVFYPGILKRIYNELGGDYYMLPSSIHEVLFVKKEENMEPEELRSIVRSVNATELEPQEILSDQVYIYTKENERLEICD